MCLAWWQRGEGHIHLRLIAVSLDCVLGASVCHQAKRQHGGVLPLLVPLVQLGWMLASWHTALLKAWDGLVRQGSPTSQVMITRLTQLPCASYLQCGNKPLASWLAELGEGFLEGTILRMVPCFLRDTRRLAVVCCPL